MIGCLLEDSERFQKYADCYSDSTIRYIYSIAEANSTVDVEALWIMQQVQALFPTEIPEPLQFLVRLQKCHDGLTHVPIELFVDRLEKELSSLMSLYSLWIYPNEGTRVN
ncbi:hypothetical protein [Chroococcidiopsis sp.]|uniref:hypothetical protein n=1 Tax=Chroococcidiopsis sp. TaxID=3088168 RepID=UPI003F2EDEA6